MRSIGMILLLVLLAASPAWADPQSTFDEGLRLYRDGQMDDAVRVWESLIVQGKASGELYYNLGNAYYRTGDVGHAILMYERARELLPRDDDVLMNLDLARMATVDRVEAPLRLVIWEWVDGVRDALSLREIARLFLILGSILLVALLAWRLTKESIRRVLRPAVVLLAAMYVLAGGWYAWRAVLATQESGIVMATKSDVYSAPDSASTQLFSLHEGTKVRTRQTLSGWVNVRLADGRQGWMPVQDVQRI